ncbi:TIGR00341 family protein [Rivihabitans pingtungensis]|uniref:TIGR00341 family protein n=1 Tax=Rivihabitans pingtungensis TaxID=1054498 RepID=UPI0028993C8D|nr:TIGR00341 family protein [Rivihabitans pingtungensis]
MDDESQKKNLSLAIRVKHIMRERFSLHDDKAEDTEIEARIRDGVELRGATPWVLIFAIFVASVGLNVNSTAVIIGAMLISPLMGPIMGAGLGVAVYDFDLVKRSLTNLGIATFISLVVSALYFSLTPLQQTQSELLARTSPTIWDVLIALFGGLAGIVGITRQEKSNVIPGVAIATALMPPVCTAGFGIATGQWQFAGGALYLYAINCVFISLATVVGIRALRLGRHGFANQKTEKRVKATLLALALITSVPSGYLALDLVRQEVFRSKAQEFVDREFTFDKSQLVDTKIDPDKRVIDLSILGEPISPEALHHIEAKLATANLEGTKLVLHQAGENRIDLTALKSSLLSDLLRESQDTVKRRDTQVQNLKAELAARDAILGQANGIFKELRQLYPEVTRVLLADGVSVTSEESKEKVVYITITTRIAMSKEIHQRTEDWLKVRLNLNSIVLNFDTEGQPLKR